MESYPVSSILKNQNETAFGVLMGPNSISWKCSAGVVVVVFPKARRLSKAAKLSNLNLQVSKLNI